MRYLLLTLLFTATTALAREPSVYVYNETLDRIEHQRNSTEYRPIASVTKLMTAMVALDHSKDLFRRLPLNTMVKSNLPRGTYTRQELFDAMLVRSDNAAAETLAADWRVTHWRPPHETGIWPPETAPITRLLVELSTNSGPWFVPNRSIGIVKGTPDNVRTYRTWFAPNPASLS